MNIKEKSKSMTTFQHTKPALFGLKHSNRDFTKKESWGKNQFNSSFPASLACYMSHKKIKPVYLTLNKKLEISHDILTVSELFGIDPMSDDLYFFFEGHFLPYQKFVLGNLPRIDFVTMWDDLCLHGIEVKLTALPDNATCENSDEDYGCEIVTRPDTIVYLALSIATTYNKSRDALLDCLEPTCSKIRDWTNGQSIVPHIYKLIDALDLFLSLFIENQKPLVMQPIWKTEGKSAKLHNDCFDMFVWSDFAFTRLFIDVAKATRKGERISRQTRSAVWTVKMLYDYAKNGRIDHKHIIDELSYNTKNDKAFAVNGSITHRYMKCLQLTKPRIKKDEIKNIILGGGQKYLSPERRLDAIIQNTPGLFD